MDERALARALAGGRVAIGVAFLGAPRLAVRAWSAEEPGPILSLAARALGVRDFVLGVGALRALSDGHSAQDWLVAGAVADASDALATVLSFEALPPARRTLLLLAAAGGAIVGARVARALR